jgi:hypothetical protein
MALFSSNVLLQMMIIFIYPIIILGVELRVTFQEPDNAKRHGREGVYEQCPNENFCSGEVLPQTSQEVNQ